MTSFQVGNKNIDNASGQVVRTDIENTFAAVASNNFGAKNSAGTILPAEFVADSSTSPNAERCLFGTSGPAGGYDIHTSTGFILDDPSYTLGQSIAYKFQFCSPHHGSYYIRINGGQTVHNSNYDKRVISYMTLMEVG